MKSGQWIIRPVRDGGTELARGFFQAVLLLVDCSKVVMRVCVVRIDRQSSTERFFGLVVFLIVEQKNAIVIPRIGSVRGELYSRLKVLLGRQSVAGSSVERN